MDWKQLLTTTTRSVDEELRLRNAYLAVENRILRHQKRREAPAFMPGRDRRWARWAQCPRAQQDPRSTRALNGRGNCREGSPGIHAGEDVPFSRSSGRLTSITTRVMACTSAVRNAHVPTVDSYH